MYLINKSALPQEIQDTLVGGDAGDKTYADYAGLNDVYGVTSDLKVYYCSGGVETITGITVAELDTDDPAREITISDSGIASVLESLSYITRNDNGTFSAQELRSITDLTIDSSASSLSDLYNLPNLQKLTIKGISLTSLAGIENCPKLYYVYNYGSVIGDYTAVGKLGEQLQYLYFYNINDSELETACSKTTGIGSYDLPNLQYFAVVGQTSYISSLEAKASSGRSGSIDTISYLANLTDTTKKAVKYLSVQNNYLTDLTGISGFTNLYLLRCEYNSLTNLNEISSLANLEYLICNYNTSLVISQKLASTDLYLFSCSNCTGITSLYFLENCTNLTYVYANYCTIGYGETDTKNTSTDSLVALDGKTSLYYLNLKYNTDLAWIDYINSCSNLTYLYLEGCTGLNSTSMYAIKTLIASLGANCSYPSSYSLALLDDDTTLLDLTDETLTKDEFETIGNYTGITHLSLKSVVIKDGDGNEITNDTDNELDTLVTSVLSKLTAMQYLQLYGVSNLSTIAFVENMEGLIELDVRDTSITDLSLLEEMTEKTEDGESSFVLEALAVNVEGTDLKVISNTLSIMSNVSVTYWISAGGESTCGLNCTNFSVWKTLEESDVSCLVIGGKSSFSETLDLSECTSLVNFYCTGLNTGNILLPNSVKIVACRYLSNWFSMGTNLESLSIALWKDTDVSEYLENVSTVRSVSISSSAAPLSVLNYFYDKNIVSFQTYEVCDSDLSGFAIPSSLETLKYPYRQLVSNSVSFSNVSDSFLIDVDTNLSTLIIRGSDLSNLSFLNELHNLVDVNLSNNNIATLEGVTNALPNVTSLNLSYNNITSLYGIQYFTGLQTLNLSYNTSLGDTCSYGGTTYFNLQLLSDLRTNNQTLTKLTLTGCTDLNTDSTNSYWTTLKGLSGLTVTGP